MHDEPGPVEPRDERAVFARRSRRAPSKNSWQRTGLILLAGFLVWLVLDSTVLQHNATVISPIGARRTAALDILNRIAGVANFLHLDEPVAAANEALGRTAVGGFSIPAVPTTLPPVGTTTTTLPPRNPTARHKLHVLIIGDSIGTDLAYPLKNDLAATGVVAVNTDVVVDTGLTRLDYFNWIKELKLDIFYDHPSLIIGMMGANDPQSFLVPEVISFSEQPKKWRAQYLRNVGTLFHIGHQDGRQMLWISVPQMQQRNSEFQIIRNIQQHAAALQHIYYYDSDDVLAPHGHFVEYLRIGGQIAQVRDSDGIHLAPAGASLLATAVVVEIEKDLHIHLG